jgi:hypothetical protein
LYVSFQASIGRQDSAKESRENEEILAKTSEKGSKR